MEKTYKKCFTLAQKHLLLKKTDKAKEILRPFITISSKRTMIQLLLRQNKEFLAFIKAVAQKDYEQVDTLIKAYPIFKEIPSYTALQKEILLSLEDISHNIKTGNIPEAINIIRELNNIPLIKEELYQLYKLAQEAKKLLLSYEKDDFIICYEIIDKNRELESMQLVKLLEEHWEKQVQKCEIYALQGNIQAVKETLDELIYIETRKEKIGNLLRVSFQSKIKKELQNMHYKSVENFIYSYIDIFGIDSELNQIIRNYEDQSNNTLAITVLDKTHKKRNSWVYKDII
jgi:low affinity Fe/Cu permease